MSAATLAADVIIVTWNGRGRVDSCLEHLARQTAPQRVIVVDNASTDGTPAMLRERHPGVDVIEMDRNVGFGRAVNAGAAAGQGDAVVLVNDDVEMDEMCLEAILAPLEHGPAVGMVAGLTTIPGSDLVDSFGIELDVTLAAYNRLRRRPAGQAPGVLLGPSGGLAAYRRRAFDEAGGFDERLFAYGEDVDLALRLRLAGWEAAEAPAARGVHLGAATIGIDSPRQRFLAGFARAFLMRRYGVLRGRHAARAIAIEALVVGAGFVRGRTDAHIKGRIAGWRAAAGERLDVPAGAVDAGIGVREALRRLLRAR
jgi:N-acetylglucosaminyl-diphospho-decaprenol L-rhamnosyltransferase